MCLDIGPFVWALEGQSIRGRIFPIDSFGPTGRLRLGRSYFWVGERSHFRPAA
jgi:hypothetical protein